ncbi:somatomedin-B and thrombospondin type-1 domain-containing protein isoform X2 [Pleurodeles waltl]|uniref:somatomedin-B and thrombospondin type-1 domain-containing protein isoform X2 n=1 Tax=Pleurodeles waltl TaxID=8319 RepID=UPI003709BDD1
MWFDSPSPSLGLMRSPSMASSLQRLLLLLALARLWVSAGAGCAEARRCCPGRDPLCASKGWRLDRVYGTCFCDEACTRARDCCYDYTQACPAQPCVVSEWSHWSGCADQCKPTLRMRRRHVQLQPKNGVPAFITTSDYNKERKRRALSPIRTSVDEDLQYCVEFKIESLSYYCTRETRRHARWMQYLREGYTVCVACQYPAMNDENQRCTGDGLDTDSNNLLHWQAVGNSRCQGTWRKVRRVEQCACPVVHSFIFT